MTHYSGKITAYALFLLFCAMLVVPSMAVTLTPGSTSITSIANGDPVFIHGIATGHPQNGLQIWVIGKNYVKISNIPVNEDNTYVYELRSSETQNLASGQYLVIIQHPMMNGEFDIVFDPAKGEVINRQLDSGKAIFQLTGPGSLQRPDAGYALMQAINSQNIDDSFTTIPFFVDAPVSLINPIGDHYIGDTFTITGSTNLAVGDDLLVEIYSSSFGPTHKLQSGEFSGSTGTVKVEAGTNGYNTWSFYLDTSAFKADEYLVKVSGVTQDVIASTTFAITERSSAAVTTVSPVTTTVTLSPNATQVTASPTQPPVTQSPLSVTGIITGLVILGIARRIGKI
jgi:trimeric autotransporter adhesin